MRKLFTITLILGLLSAVCGCKSPDTKQISTLTDSIKNEHVENVKAIENSDRSMVLFKQYTEAWGQFQDVAQDERLYKTMFEETGNNKYADKYNNLLPKYHKYGRRMDSLYKLTRINKQTIK